MPSVSLREKLTTICIFLNIVTFFLRLLWLEYCFLLRLIQNILLQSYNWLFIHPKGLLALSREGMF